MTNIYYWPFEYGKETKANRMLQLVLAEYGYLKDEEVDGIFGSKTKTALEFVQQKYGLPVTGIVDRATEDLLFPGNYERRTPFMSDVTKPNWLSSLTGNTIFNYLLTFIGGVIASRFGLDPDLFRDNLPNIMDAVIGVVGAIGALIGAFRGIKAAATPKVNLGSATVALKEMPPAAQRQVVAAVESTTGKSVTQ
jgi:peptidoglycan hydrolase-like protein with peptidoglycan-binding domain